MEQRNIKILQELVKRPGNSVCGDCGSKEIEYASYNIGIFLCSRCASLHTQMGTHISKVKHLKLDHWEDSQVERLKQVGNLVAKSKFEARVPLGFRKPCPSASNVLPPDPQILVDHWITSKYVREEFTSPDYHSSTDSSPLRPYLLGVMDSFLMKKGREDPRYFPRRFVLDPTTLRYFVKEKSNPKAVIKLVDLDVCLAPQKCSKPYSLQLSYLKDGSTRHLYVYHDDSELVMQWYHAIRIGKLGALKRNYSANARVYSPESIVSFLGQDSLMEGYLWKAGPSPSYAHRRRWFVLCNRKLMYHVEPLDAYPKGEIFLGSSGTEPLDTRQVEQAAQSASKLYDIEIKNSSTLSLNGYKVSEGGFGDDKMDPHRWVFSLHTPYRTFILASESQSERDKWVAVIDHVLRQDLTPRDIATCSLLVRKRNGSTLANLSISNPLSGLLSSSSSSTTPTSTLSSNLNS